MALMSKRAQARAEKELHDLLQVPGNSTCADCGARNPSWASWNLGAFLCMRCASIHRKLGTHISKVKSLSMDTWTNDQVEVMRKNGNLMVNTIYNPKNKQPDIPLDADEVDGAMERYIRKKYQEKSLSDGRPEVPSRDDILPPRPRSPETSPPPMLPSKKSRFLKFGLRSSSSAYPLSKHDKKHRNEPQVGNSSRITSEDYTTTRRTSGSRSEMSDYDLQVKLGQLRDMGFSDNERNTNLLKRNNGDVERTIAALVRLGPSEQPAPRRTTPTPTVSTTPAATTQTSVSAPVSATTSLNPWGQASQGTGFGISFGSNAPPQTSTPSVNPWQTQMSNQAGTGLEQSFSNLQVSQNLFPHSTGGYSTQPQYPNQATVQQALNVPQQYQMTGSPVSTSNPFMPAPVSANSTGSNPYASHMQAVPGFAPSTNPFLAMQANNHNQQANMSSQGFNPFGLPPSSSPPQARSQSAGPPSQFNPFDNQAMYPEAGAHSSPYGGGQFAQHQNSMQSNGPQSPPVLPNFQQAQPQSPQFQYQQQSPQYFPQQQPAMSPQAQQNPYWQQSQQQPSPQLPQQQQQAMSPQSPQNPYWQQQSSPQIPQQPQQQQQQQQQPPSQPMSPQQTGHLDKKSILALYNFPQLAPAKPLASIPEPADEQGQPQTAQTQQSQQPTSSTPSGGLYNGSNNASAGKRSATMPVSSMHSAGGTGSRNPFMNNANGAASNVSGAPNQQLNPLSQGARHASHDSMVVNNQKLQEGRHSPDAFASLSARYMR